MKTIQIFTSDADNFLQQFGSFYSAFKGVQKDEQLHFDLSNANWLCPIILLPIAAYSMKTNSSVSTSKNFATKTYLDTIHFPVGINSTAGFEYILKSQKTYVPISVLNDLSVKILSLCFRV